MAMSIPEAGPALPVFQALPEVLYQSLRENILNGSLPPGNELRQETLAKHYGVSRVPLREALSRLQAEGLIVLRPRRGFAVTSLDLAEIIEIFELRMVLGQHALETATRLRTEADVKAVEALLTAMNELDPTAEDYLASWLDLNRAFHNRLVASARRQRLSILVGNLKDTIEPYVRMESYFTGQVDDAAVEHQTLFEAFRDRQVTRAGEISRDHCLGSMNRLVDSIRRYGLSPVISHPKKPRKSL